VFVEAPAIADSSGAGGIAVRNGVLWVTNTEDDTVSRIGLG